MPADEFFPDNFREIKEVLVVKYPINVLLIVLDQLFRPKFASIFVFVFQLLQS